MAAPGYRGTVTGAPSFLGSITCSLTTPEWLILCLVWDGIVGAIAGAITETDLRVTGIAVAGFVVAATALSLMFAVVPSPYPGELEGEEAARAAFVTWLGLPPGQKIPAVASAVAKGVGAPLMVGGPIWSALIGVNIKKRKGWR
jgi:hypothetical protein